MGYNCGVANDTNSGTGHDQTETWFWPMILVLVLVCSVPFQVPSRMPSGAGEQNLLICSMHSIDGCYVVGG